METKRKGERLSVAKKIVSRTGKISNTNDLAEGSDMNKSTLQSRILKRMKKGTCTIKTLAHNMGMGERTVEAVLAFMVHDGYIEEVSCNNNCKLCPMSCNQDTLVKMYALTSKSIKYLEQ